MQQISAHNRFKILMPDLSIIIPALNEEKKIAADVRASNQFFIDHNLNGEIIIVDDGSEDKTADAAKSVPLAPSNRLQVIRYPRHQGKGHAVRQGILASTGSSVMFMDSGLNIPLSFVVIGLDLLRSGSWDIAMGSRHLPESRIMKPMVWYRQITSFLFRKLTRLYFNLPRGLTDTQCGFKIYRGDVARQIYSQCQSDGFVFDLEIIIRADRAGLRMCEFPVDWTCDRDSRLSVTATPNLLKELQKIKSALR